MNRTKYYIAFFAFLAVVAGMIGCGKSNTSNNPNSVAVPPVPLNGVCPVGTTPYNNGYGAAYCVDASGNIVNTTYGNNQLAMSYSSDNYYLRNLTVSNSGTMYNFLKLAMGVCDRTQSTGGVYDCASWANGYFKMVLQAVNGAANTLVATFYAYPSTSQYYWYGYQLPSLSQFFAGMLGFPVFSGYTGIMRNPLPLSMTVSVINNNQGFEARAYGDYYTQANRSLIQIQVANGKLGNSSLPFIVGFEGSAFLSGNLVNCAYSYCGY